MKNLLCVIAVVALVAGCSTPPQPYVPTVNTYSGAVSPKMEQVSFTADVTDVAFAEWLQVIDFRHSMTNDGYDKVEVKARNATTSPLRVRYRFEWQNANGEEVRDPGVDAWEKFTVTPGRACTLSSMAPAQKCGSVRLLLKNIVQ